MAFQCRNPIHRAHYELFIRSLDAPNVQKGSVVLVHPTCGPTQEDDIDGVTRYRVDRALRMPHSLTFSPVSAPAAFPRNRQSALSQ